MDRDADAARGDSRGGRAGWTLHAVRRRAPASNGYRAVGSSGEAARERDRVTIDHEIKHRVCNIVHPMLEEVGCGLKLSSKLVPGAFAGAAVLTALTVLMISAVCESG